MPICMLMITFNRVSELINLKNRQIVWPNQDPDVSGHTGGTLIVTHKRAEKR